MNKLLYIRMFFVKAVFILFPIYTMFSQTTEIDSLSEALKITSGNEKAVVLSLLCRSLYQYNQQLGIEYGKQALQIIDSLKTDKNRAAIFNNIGLNYLMLSQHATARQYFEQAYKLSTSQNDSLELSISLNRLGLIYEQSANYDSTLIVFNKELKIDIQRNDKKRAARALENIGTIHLHRGELKSALNYLLESKSILDSLSLKKELTQIYLKIGNIYIKEEDFETAKKYFTMSYVLAEENTDKLQMCISLNSLAVIEKKLKKFDKAIEKYLESLKIAESINNYRVANIIYANLGNVYSLKENQDKALEYLNKALETSKKLNLVEQEAINYYNIGEVYRKKLNFTTAKSYYEKALSIFEKAENHENVLKCYEQIIIVANELSDYKISASIYELYVTLKDSLYINEKNNELEKLKTQFRTEQIADENTILQHENLLKEKTITQQHTAFALISVILVLLIVLLVVIYYNRKRILYAKQLVEQKNSDIAAYAEELRTINDKLVSLDHFKTGMTNMIVHDLKNPLNNLLNVAYIQESERQRVVQQNSKLMLNLVQDLLDVCKYENTFMKLNLCDVALSELVNSAHAEVAYAMNSRNLTLELIISERINVKCDKEIIHRVLVNLLTNAIKYSPHNSKITIEANDLIINKKKLVRTFVTDNGIGIPENHREKVFEKFVQFNVQKNEKIRSTGLGLSFCKLAVESHEGSIAVVEHSGQGARFEFTLPKAEVCYVEELKTTERSKICFTSEEKLVINQYVKELQDIPIYKISNINSIIKKIQSASTSENIKNWSNSIYNAAINGNEQQFAELIQNY